MKNFEPPKILGKFYTNSSFIIYITVPQSLQRSEERFAATGCVSEDSATGLHKTAKMCRRLKCIKLKFFSTHLLRDEWIFCNFATAFEMQARVWSLPRPDPQKGRESERSAKLAFEMQNNQENALSKHVLLRGGTAAIARNERRLCGHL